MYENGGGGDLGHIEKLRGGWRMRVVRGDGMRADEGRQRRNEVEGEGESRTNLEHQFLLYDSNK